MISLACSGPARSLLFTLAASLSLFVGCGSPTPSKGSGAGGSSASGASTSHGSSSSSSGSSTGGSAASSTASSSSSSSGTDGGGTACSSLPLCEDFESSAPNTPPAAPLWSLSAELGCSSVPVGAITIDNTVAHGGTKSVKVLGPANSCGIWFGNTSVFSKVGLVFFVRFYVRFGTAVTTGHANFTAMRDNNLSTTPKDTADTSLGAIQSTLIWNRRSDDASLPDQVPGMPGVGLEASQAPPAANTWTCFEYGIDETKGSIQVWVDSKEIKGLEENGTAVQNISDQWLNKPWMPAFADVRFGWVSFGPPATTLWYDDIAVSTSRIGCN